MNVSGYTPRESRDYEYASMIRVLAWPIGSAHDLNPYVTLMYSWFVPPAATLIAYRPLMRHVPEADVFHVQWPEGIFEGKGGKIQLVAMAKAWRVISTADKIRRGGGRVVLTAHNLTPHAALPRWQKRLYDRYFLSLLKRVDLIVALTNEALTLFRATYPVIAKTAAEVVPHPHYRQCYTATLSGADARTRWGLPRDGTVMGMIGSIRPSKSVPEAIKRFKGVSREGESLLVAGECSSEAEWKNVLRAAEGSYNVILRRGQLNNADMANAFSAIDICLIHQQQILNSGTALMALSMNVPVVAPAVGSFPELAKVVGSRWMALVPEKGNDADSRRAMDAAAAVKGQRCDALDAFDPKVLSLMMLHIFQDITFKPAR